MKFGLYISNEYTTWFNPKYFVLKWLGYTNKHK